MSGVLSRDGRCGETRAERRRDVANDQVRVFPHLTAFVCLHLASEQFDESRLSGSVRPENGDA